MWWLCGAKEKTNVRLLPFHFTPPAQSSVTPAITSPVRAFVVAALRDTCSTDFQERQHKMKRLSINIYSRLVNKQIKQTNCLITDLSAVRARCNGPECDQLSNNAFVDKSDV